MLYYILDCVLHVLNTFLTEHGQSTCQQMLDVFNSRLVLDPRSIDSKDID